MSAKSSAAMVALMKTAQEMGVTVAELTEATDRICKAMEMSPTESIKKYVHGLIQKTMEQGTDPLNG